MIVLRWTDSTKTMISVGDGSGMFVPVDPYNRDYRRIRDLMGLAEDQPLVIADDGTPLPEQPPPPAPVQPTEPVEVSASPSEEITPSDGGAAPQEEPPPAAVVVEPSAPAYAGTMVIPDEEGPLRGYLTKRITEIEEDRLAAVDDPNARARQIWGFTTFTNLTRGGNEIPADVQAAYEEFLRVQPIIDRIEGHAKQLRKAAITVPFEMLQAMVTGIEEGWP